MAWVRKIAAGYSSSWWQSTVDSFHQCMEPRASRGFFLLGITNNCERESLFILSSRGGRPAFVTVVIGSIHSRRL